MLVTMVQEPKFAKINISWSKYKEQSTSDKHKTNARPKEKPKIQVTENSYIVHQLMCLIEVVNSGYISGDFLPSLQSQKRKRSVAMA